MAEQHLNGSEIFVVDDDELMRDTLSAVFAPEGCRVTCFAEGQPFLVAGAGADAGLHPARRQHAGPLRPRHAARA
jgi:CheY-like chemotaxis protein